MLLTALPKPAGHQVPALPVVYSDHFLFYEELEQNYDCPEQSSALGILMTDSGECNYFVNGHRNRLQRGQLMPVNRESRLAIHSKKQAAPALLFFHSRLPDLVQHSLEHSHEHLLEEHNDEQSYDFSYLERIHDNPQLYQTIQLLIALGGSCSSFASLKADIMIRNLFEQLLRENQVAVRLSKNINVVKVSTRLEIYKRISAARDWIAANHTSRITLEAMATVANMNSQHFLRLFKQTYQITPHQYLIALKLDKARHLLTNTPQTVTAVCQVIGFESVQSFSLLFRKKFGVSPSASRR